MEKARFDINCPGIFEPVHDCELYVNGEKIEIDQSVQGFDLHVKAGEIPVLSIHRLPYAIGRKVKV